MPAGVPRSWPPPWPEITDEAVREAMRRVPRDQFVAETYRHWAYDDRPLPIGYDQTISQPFIVAYMTQAIKPQPAQRVLEIGTGCGYQTAVLAEVCQEVDSVETIEPLATEAAERLQTLGYDNVHVHVGDGYAGWPPAAPYDGIVVTAAPPEIPSPLVEQLAEGGRMVIPVGGRYDDQTLLLIEKHKGRVHRRSLLLVRFVPLLHPGGSHEP